VLHQIGSGVLGPVFRTYEPQRDRLIAVKAFRLDLVPEDVARLAEALRRLAGASLSHPSLVPAVDAGLEGTMAFLAMDYVAGETLDVAFRHLAPAPLDSALPVLTQIAEALEAGWAANLGHGALHPRDVFLTAGTNDVRVTGVGVVPALESTGVKAPVRRPYSAPERAAGEAWDIRADVYSLGAIAHELLTRRRPAGAGEQDGALATGLTPEQRVSIRRVLAAALAERPEHRFASPGAFVQALSAVTRGETPDLPAEPEAAPPAPVEKPAVPRKRAPATPPLLEVIDTLGAEAPAAPAAAPAPPPAPLPAPPAMSLSEFESEGPRSAERARPTEARVAPSEPVAETPPLAQRPPATPIEPFSSRARSVPPPFLGSSPPSPPFPWVAVIAAGVACLVLGGVGGYEIGRRGSPAAGPAAAAEPARSQSSDTDVRVTPPPAVVTPTAEAAPAAALPAAPAPQEKTASAPRNTPSAGRVVVRSVPSGALVTIDGRRYGTTPATVRELLLGSHTLQVAHPGYVPSSQPLVLTSSQPTKEITVELQPSASGRAAETGSISVDSRPRGARVLLDGREVGVTPLRLRSISSGSHAVRIELAGYKPVATTVTVKGGAESTVAVTLEEGRGSRFRVPGSRF
jgi:serine/threonine-protein kinase